MDVQSTHPFHMLTPYMENKVYSIIYIGGTASTACNLTSDLKFKRFPNTACKDAIVHVPVNHNTTCFERLLFSTLLYLHGHTLHIHGHLNVVLRLVPHVPFV